MCNRYCRKHGKDITKLHKFVLVQMTFGSAQIFKFAIRKQDIEYIASSLFALFLQLL